MVVSLSTAPTSMIAGVEKGRWLQLLIEPNGALIFGAGVSTSHHPPFDEDPSATPLRERTSGIVIQHRVIRARSCQGEGGVGKPTLLVYSLGQEGRTPDTAKMSLIHHFAIVQIKALTAVKCVRRFHPSRPSICLYCRPEAFFHNTFITPPPSRPIRLFLTLVKSPFVGHACPEPAVILSRSHVDIP